MNRPAGGDDCFSRSSPQQTNVASVRTAQLCRNPTLTAENVPAGGNGPEPQQANVPSVRIAHVRVNPTLTAVYVPVGAVAPEPQQANVPSVRSAQLRKKLLALTAVNVPAGGEVAPPSSLPQHASVESDRIAQLCEPPALTAVNVPPGGDACCTRSSPQQARVPSLRIAQACEPPALTAVNVPPGGEARPSPLLPQQANVPSVRTAQPCWSPALIATAPGRARTTEKPSGADDAALPADHSGVSASAIAATTRARAHGKRPAGRMSMVMR